MTNYIFEDAAYEKNIQTSRQRHSYETTQLKENLVNALIHT